MGRSEPRTRLTAVLAGGQSSKGRTGAGVIVRFPGRKSTSFGGCGRSMFCSQKKESQGMFQVTPQCAAELKVALIEAGRTSTEAASARFSQGSVALELRFQNEAGQHIANAGGRGSHRAKSDLPEPPNAMFRVELENGATSGARFPGSGMPFIRILPGTGCWSRVSPTI